MSPGRRGDERRCQGSLRHHAGGKVHKAVGPWDALANPRVRQNRVVPTPEILCVKPSRRWRGQPAAHRSGSRAVTGAIVQRSPRRARHKPSTHRAGKAGCSATPVCCCAVLPACAFRAADRGCRPAPGLPCALSDKRAERRCKARAHPAARTRCHVCGAKSVSPCVSRHVCFAMSVSWTSPATSMTSPPTRGPELAGPAPRLFVRRHLRPLRQIIPARRR